MAQHSYTPTPWRAEVAAIVFQDWSTDPNLQEYAYVWCIQHPVFVSTAACILMPGKFDGTSSGGASPVLCFPHVQGLGRIRHTANSKKNNRIIWHSHNSHKQKVTVESVSLTRFELCGKASESLENGCLGIQLCYRTWSQAGHWEVLSLWQDCITIGDETYCTPQNCTKHNPFLCFLSEWKWKPPWELKLFIPSNRKIVKFTSAYLIALLLHLSLQPKEINRTQQELATCKESEMTQMIERPPWLVKVQLQARSNIGCYMLPVRKTFLWACHEREASRQTLRGCQPVPNLQAMHSLAVPWRQVLDGATTDAIVLNSGTSSKGSSELGPRSTWAHGHGPMQL